MTDVKVDKRPKRADAPSSKASDDHLQDPLQSGGIDCSKPVQKPQANGCGPANIPLGSAVGNALYPLFKEDCDTHDVGGPDGPGYATLGATKEQADTSFKDNMLQTCAETYKPQDKSFPFNLMEQGKLNGCKTDALELWGTVATEGDASYEEAQVQAKAYQDYVEACGQQ